MSLSFQKKPESANEQPTEANTEQSAMQAAMDAPTDAAPTPTQQTAPPTDAPAESPADAPAESPTDESSSTDETSEVPLIEKIKGHKLFRPGLYGLAGVVALLVVVQAINLFYVGVLLDAGIESVQKGKYKEAASHIAKYTESQGRSQESDLWLGRAYVFSGTEEETQKLLEAYNNSSETPELFYMQALSSINDDRESTEQKLRRITSTDNHPYVNGALGIIALLDEKYTESSFQLETARNLLEELSGEEREIAEKHLRGLYKIYLRHIGRIPEQAPALPFAQPTVPRNKLFTQLGFDMGLEGFHNNYIIPFDEELLGSDAEDAGSLFESLHFISRLREKPQDAEDIVATFSERDDVSLLTRYIVGYNQITAGDYTGAAKTYQRINEKSASAFSQAYEGAALWIASEGAPPSAEILAAFDKAIELKPDNLTAQNNRGFLYLYADDLDTAATAVQAATDINSVAPYVVVNRLAIDLAKARIQKQKSGDVADLINSVINAFQASPYILNLAAQLDMVNGRYGSAVKYASKLYKDDPSPVLVEFITNIYRIRGQDRLAIATFISEEKRYPEDENIRLGFLLAQARGGSADKFEQLIKKHNIPVDSAHVLYGKSLLSSETDPEEAINLAKQALDKADDSLKIYIMTSLARLYAKIKDAELAQQILDEAVALDKKLILWGAVADDITAIQYRINAIAGNVDIEAIKLSLDELAKRENILSQIDLCWALIELKEYQFAAERLEIVRKLVAPEASTPHLFQALIVAYNKTGDLIKAQEARRQYNLVVIGKYKAAEGGEGAEAIESPQSAAADGKEVFAAINAATKEKDYKRLVKLYSQLLEFPDFFPDQPKPLLTYQNRGAAYIYLKKFKEASDDFEQALKISADSDLEPKHIQSIRYNYVYSLLQIKDFNKAATEVVPLVQATDDPNILTYRLLQARILTRQKNFKKAEEVYRGIIAENRNSINLYIELARMFRSAGDLKGGVNVLSEALKIDANSAKAHLEIIKFYKRLGQSDLAERHKAVLKTL